jgi:ABC-type multidrug transport system permease subunit
MGEGNMSDAELMLIVESRKKSGLVAALLNLFLPGAGYIYCGRWILGIVAFFFVVALLVSSLGYAAIGLALVLVIDGALCARRYNQKMVERTIKERASLSRKAEGVAA